MTTTFKSKGKFTAVIDQAKYYIEPSVKGVYRFATKDSSIVDGATLTKIGSPTKTFDREYEINKDKGFKSNISETKNMTFYTVFRIPESQVDGGCLIWGNWGSKSGITIWHQRKFDRFMIKTATQAGGGIEMFSTKDNVNGQYFFVLTTISDNKITCYMPREGVKKSKSVDLASRELRGNLSSGGHGNASFGKKAIVAEFGAWDRVLTDFEIQRQYEITKKQLKQSGIEI